MIRYFRRRQYPGRRLVWATATIMTTSRSPERTTSTYGKPLILAYRYVPVNIGSDSVSATTRSRARSTAKTNRCATSADRSRYQSLAKRYSRAANRWNSSRTVGISSLLAIRTTRRFHHDLQSADSTLPRVKDRRETPKNPLPASFPRVAKRESVVRFLAIPVPPQRSSQTFVAWLSPVKNHDCDSSTHYARLWCWCPPPQANCADRPKRSPSTTPRVPTTLANHSLTLWPP